MQDDHISEVAGERQAWADGWCERFGLPFAKGATGYGHDSTQVGAVVASGELLTGYYDAVHEKTQDYLRTLGPADSIARRQALGPARDSGCQDRERSR